jgi:hypothetical protein
MKDSKFIELLNLYVDHHISPADAAALEAEVRANPERRRVYTQYCRMQKACNQLGETFRSENPAPAAASKIVDFKPRRRGLAVATYAAGIAAVAACIAVVYVVRNDQGAASPAVTPTTTVAQATPSLPPAPIARTESARPQLHPAFGPRSLTLRGQNADVAEVNLGHGDSPERAEQVAFADWINDVRISALDRSTIDELRFDGAPAIRPVTPVDPRSVRPFQGKVEMTAFKFQR